MLASSIGIYVHIYGHTNKTKWASSVSSMALDSGRGRKRGSSLRRGANSLSARNLLESKTGNQSVRNLLETKAGILGLARTWII